MAWLLGGGRFVNYKNWWGKGKEYEVLPKVYKRTEHGYGTVFMVSSARNAKKG
jgi:hypothetical protein